MKELEWTDLVTIAKQNGISEDEFWLMTPNEFNNKINERALFKESDK